MREIKNIAVFGAGKMGNGIAQLFAAGGYPVYLWAFDEAEKDRAQEIIRSNLGLLVENNIYKEEQLPDILSRISITTDYDQVAQKADLAIECILEKMELKQEFFQKLDGMTDPDVILCTNTSVMSVTEIASKAVHKERIVGTQFRNPPFLIPLVEVVKTVYVADGIAEQVCRVLENVGKKPIIAKKDVPGFIANRMQNALGREAVSIVANGIADPADVDTAVKYSFGMRLGSIGPIEQIDSIGADLCLNIGSYIYPHLENSTEASPLLKEKVANKELGFKTGGVGMQTWTEEEMKAFNERTIRDLIRVGKALGMF